jgi:hypothetical protein
MPLIMIYPCKKCKVVWILSAAANKIEWHNEYILPH